MNRLEAIEQEFGFAKQTVRWRAEKGEHYWYINTLFRATKGTERGNKANDIHFNSGNYFATYEKALITATKMQKDIGRITEAVKKQIPQKVKEYEDKYYSCPICGNVLMHKWLKYPDELCPKSDGLPYCLSCGQRLDWSDDDD